MDLNFFKKTRVLDGGMGQELLARGMKPNGTLWSANAILDENYHQLLSDTHRDFVKAGAEVIVTTTFTTRRKRLRDNDVEDKFEYLNKKAGQQTQPSFVWKKYECWFPVGDQDTYSNCSQISTAFGSACLTRGKNRRDRK